ncbi:MAG: hypothetical protein M3442_15235 [Chloroflexota bacterium]|nr:hypothetical protein [Chloroflexota bacterium]
MALIVGGALSGQLTTYQAAADGPWLPYLVATLCAATGALLAAGWALLQDRRAWIAPALALAAVLPVTVIHARRLQLRWAPVEVALGPALSFRQVLEPTLRGAAAVRPLPAGVELRVPPESVGYLEVRPLPVTPAPWDLPRGLLVPDAAPAQESLIWRASVQRDREYFVLVEVQGLLVQLTSWGLVISPTAPGAAGALPVSRTVPNGSTQEWTLRRAGGRVFLLNGREEIWQGRDVGPFRSVRLGETRTDAEHGGTLLLQALRLSRTLEPDPT